MDTSKQWQVAQVRRKTTKSSPFSSLQRVRGTRFFRSFFFRSNALQRRYSSTAFNGTRRGERKRKNRSGSKWNATDGKVGEKERQRETESRRNKTPRVTAKVMVEQRDVHSLLTNDTRANNFRLLVDTSTKDTKSLAVIKSARAISSSVLQLWKPR